MSYVNIKLQKLKYNMFVASNVLVVTGAGLTRRAGCDVIIAS